MAGRGVEAYQNQAKAAAERRVTGFANILLLKDGEAVTGRFRGLIRAPAYEYNEAELLTFNEDQAVALAEVLGVYPSWDDEKHFVASILTRYKQREPFVYQQHYIARNAGAEAYSTCGSSWNPICQCVGCYLKERGDKAVSIRDQVVLSFVPYRKYHKVASSVAGRKGEYPWCANLDGGTYCRLCASGNEAKWEGLKYLSLAPMHAGVVMACAERIGDRCKCGIGKARNAGWACSNPVCGDPIGNPPLQDDGIPAPIICSECRHQGRPVEIVKCSKGCEDARRAQLHEVDVLVQRIGDSKKTTYSFTEQWPCEPLLDELLKFNLPSYEDALKPRTVDAQCRQYGLVSNPFTGGALAAPPSQTTGYGPPDDGQPQGNPYGGEPNVDEDIPF